MARLFERVGMSDGKRKDGDPERNHEAELVSMVTALVGKQERTHLLT